MLAHSDPDRARQLLDDAQQDVVTRWRLYEHLAALPPAPAEGKP